MAKYNKEIVNKICSLISSDDYTIAEICEQVGISRETYNTWKNTKVDFSDAIKKAEEQRLEIFKKAARSGLLTLLKGKEFDEVTTEFANDREGNQKTKYEKRVKKFILPNPTSVIFALKNLDSDNFKDIFKQELTGKDGKPIQTESKRVDEYDYDKLPSEVLHVLLAARINNDNDSNGK